MVDTLSDSEIAQVASLLSKLEPGYLPGPIFRQFTRLGVTAIIEVVPLRKTNDGNIEILLLQRPADDPVWPGQLHIPGTVLLATDTAGNYEAAFQRIYDELSSAPQGEPVLVQYLFHHSGRGMECSQVYWAEVAETHQNGTYYDAANLPQSLVKSQLDFIPQAIEAFKAKIGSV